MNIKGAIFDMDGTLIDSLMYWDDLYKRIGKKYFNDESFYPSSEIDKTIRPMIYADAMSRLRECYNIPAEPDEFLSFCERGISEFYRNVAKPKKGARELLEDLKKKNVKICLASATAIHEVKAAIKYHGISEYFDFVISCADIGVGKDKPDIFLKALSLMELSADSVCVFEDSFVALETAKSLGCQTVGVFDEFNSEQKRLMASSDIYLGEGKSLYELSKIIQKAE